MISYAQNHEDVLLDRAFQGQETGFYIDVGANDPVTLSVTKHFSMRGWRGINIEPGTAPHRRLCADRPKDVNLNVGIAAESGELTLFECPENDALSTCSAVQAEEHRVAGLKIVPRTVPVQTLDEICRNHVRVPIDFLTIDVEGFEREVLTGANLSHWRPRVVVVEATRPSTSEESHAEWQSMLIDAGYELACFDGLNRFYARSDEPNLAARLAVPVNVTDRFEPYEVARLRNEIETKEAALHEFTDECRQLREQLLEKESAIDDKQLEIDRLAVASKRKEDAIREKQAAILRMEAALRESAAARRKEVEQVRCVCRKLEADLQATHEQLAEAQGHAQGSIGRLHEQLHEKQAQLEGAHGALQAKADDLTAAQQALAEKHAALHDSIQYASTLQQQLEEKHSALHEALDRSQHLLERSLWERLRNVA